MDTDELQAALDEQTAILDEVQGELTQLRRQVAAYQEHEAEQVASIKAVTARLRASLAPTDPATTS